MLQYAWRARGYARIIQSSTSVSKCFIPSVHSHRKTFSTGNINNETIITHEIQKNTVSNTSQDPVDVTIHQTPSGVVVIKDGKVVEQTPEYKAETRRHEEEAMVSQIMLDLQDLFEEANYKAAVKRAEEGVEMAKDVYGIEHVVYAAFLNNHALALKGMGELQMALEKYEEALKIYTKVVGEYHHSTGACTANIGLLYKALAEQSDGMKRTEYLEEALNFLRRSLDIRTCVINDEAPAVAVTKQHIAGVLRLQQQYDEAETLLREALTVLAKRPGKNHRLYATALNNLGLLLKNMERFDEAETTYLDAYKRRVELFGEDHPDVINTEYNLSELAAARGDTNTDMLIKAKIAARVLGDENSSTSSHETPMVHHEEAKTEQVPSIETGKQPSSEATENSKNPQSKDSSLQGSNDSPSNGENPLLFEESSRVIRSVLGVGGKMPFKLDAIDQPDASTTVRKTRRRRSGTIFRPAVPQDQMMLKNERS